MKIVEPMVWDGFNQQVKADSTVCGTITRNVGADLKRNEQGIIEPNEEYIGCAVHPISKKLEFDGYKDSVCPTLLATDYKCPKTVAFQNKQTYRIRKLTERECFRLMGVKNADFERVNKNQSTSSLYHEAGDALVTTVLMAILGELLGISDYKDKIDKLVDELKGNCYE